MPTFAVDGPSNSFGCNPCDRLTAVLIPQFSMLARLCFAVTAVLLTILTFTPACISQVTSISGVVNSYAALTGFDRCSNSATISATAGFSPGDEIVIIQMKGAEVDTSNTPAFGALLKLNGAGQYEFATLSAVTGNTIVFRNNLLHDYDPAGLVQVVKVARYSDADVIDTLTAVPWNGSSGGILALDVAGSLSLHADISATGLGFRGGILTPGDSTCGVTSLFQDPALFHAAVKGEGICDPKLIKFEAGRGQVANAGGGGDASNSGGGGGGNCGRGGSGGRQWGGCNQTLANGGMGGYTLPYSNAVNRVYMGGGGGAGHQNDNNGTRGTNGGGLIFIRSSILLGNGHRISADGEIDTTTAFLDGAGGGGAGGGVLLDVQRYIGTASISAHGGSGGNSTNIDTSFFHGTGGGGGGGIVWFSGSVPAVSVDVSEGPSGKYILRVLTGPDSTYGASAGIPGRVLSGLVIPSDNVVYSPAVSVEKLPTLQAAPGDTITIPLMLQTSQGLDFPNAWHFKAAIRVNRNSLYSLTQGPSAAIGTNDVLFQVEGIRRPGTDTLAILPFIVAIGSQQVVPLQLDSFAWDSATCPITESRIAGQLTITTCQQGSPRLLESKEEAALKPARPEPVSALSKIEYVVLEEGEISLDLIDQRGSTVASLANGWTTPGHHFATLDAKRIPSGVYLMVYRTPTERFVRTMLVCH